MAIKNKYKIPLALDFTPSGKVQSYKAGLSIEILIEYVSLLQKGNETLDVRKELLVEQRKKIVEKIDELQNTLGYLDKKLDGYEDHMMKIEEQLKKFSK